MSASDVEDITQKFQRLTKILHFYSNAIKSTGSLSGISEFIDNEEILRSQVKAAKALIENATKNSIEINNKLNKSSEIFKESISKAADRLNKISSQKIIADNVERKVQFSQDIINNQIDDETLESSDDIYHSHIQKSCPLLISLKKKMKVSLDCITDLTIAKNKIYCSSTDYTISRIDLEKKHLSTDLILRGVDSELTAVTTCHDGRFIVGGTFNTGLYVWDLLQSQSSLSEEDNIEFSIFHPRNSLQIPISIEQLESFDKKSSEIIFAKSHSKNTDSSDIFDKKQSTLSILKTLDIPNDSNNDDNVPNFEIKAFYPLKTIQSSEILVNDDENQNELFIAHYDGSNQIYSLDINKMTNNAIYRLNHKTDAVMHACHIDGPSHIIACAYDNFEIVLFDLRDNNYPSNHINIINSNSMMKNNYNFNNDNDPTKIDRTIDKPLGCFLAHSSPIGVIRIIRGPSNISLLTISSHEGIMRLWDLRMSNRPITINGPDVSNGDQMTTACWFDSLVHSHKNNKSVSSVKICYPTISNNNYPKIITAGYDGDVNIFSIDSCNSL